MTPRSLSIALTLLLLALVGCGDDASGAANDAASDAVDEVVRDDAIADPDGLEDADTAPGDTGSDTDSDDAAQDDAAEVTDTALDLADAAADLATDAVDSRAGDAAEDTGLDLSDLSDLSDATDLSDTTDTPDAAPDRPDDPDGADGPDAVDLSDGGDADATTDDPTDTVDAAPESCEVLEPRIETRQREAGYCERSAQCAVRDNALCPFGGCFTYFASGADLSALDTDERAYEDQDCSSLRCACPPQPPLPFCEAGSCVACPITCPWVCDLDCDCVQDGCGCDLPLCTPSDPASCADLGEALVEAAEDLTGCQADSDCIAVTSGVCSVLPCRVSVNAQGAVAHLGALVEVYLAAGCEPEPSCGCDGAAAPQCVEGRCRLP